MTKPIYLDYAAATPLDERVLKAMQPYFSDNFYNPSATYLAGRAVRTDLETARSQIARLLGTRPAEIIFTAGATEANNLAIAGPMRRFPDSELLVSAIEHESVLVPAKKFAAQIIPVTKQGYVDLAKLLLLINDKTVLVSVMLVNNELGTIQTLREIITQIAKVRQARLKSGNKLPLYLHTDAAQAGNWLDLHVSHLGIDLMTISGAKIYGPKQTGALFIKAGVQLEPLIAGGAQEFGLRAGTENVAGWVGLAAALEIAQTARGKCSKQTTQLRQLFVDELNKALPRVVINGGKLTAPHILSVSFPGVDNERLMMQLDEAGVQAAVGSACSASNNEPSHVLKAIGLSDAHARSTLRFSLGRPTTAVEIRQTVKLLKKLADG